MIYFPDSISSPFEAWRVGAFLIATVCLAGWGVRTIFDSFLAVMNPSGKD